MSEQKDTYLKQLADEADMAGTYLSGVSGRLTVEQVEKIHGIIEKYSTDVVDYETATDDINAALWPNAPALTSGDGSESAGLREAAQAVIDWEQEYRTLNHLGKNPPHPFVQLAIALAAPAISRPPTQGASLPPSRADLGGDRVRKLVTKWRGDAQEAIPEGYQHSQYLRGKYLKMDTYAAGLDDCAHALEAALELDDAIDEGQQSSELVEKTSRDTEGESR